MTVDGLSGALAFTGSSVPLQRHRSIRDRVLSSDRGHQAEDLGGAGEHGHRHWCPAGGPAVLGAPLAPLH
jgi:hypothetical protein